MVGLKVDSDYSGPALICEQSCLFRHSYTQLGDGTWSSFLYYLTLTVNYYDNSFQLFNDNSGRTLYSDVFSFFFSLSVFFVFNAKMGTTNYYWTGLSDISLKSLFSRDLNHPNKFPKIFLVSRKIGLKF